ncbi:glycosyltransferase family protein [Virgibacillus sp. FSP13]
MLNILFIANDTSEQLHKMYYYLEQELAKTVNLTTWRKPGHMDYILNQLLTRPDFILLLNDIGRQMEPMMNGLSRTGIPTGLFVNDVHRLVKLRKNYISKHNIAHLFTVTRDKFIELYPEFINKMEWFPHFVQTDIFQDYGMQKDIDLLMMGAVNDVYPLRQKILKANEGNPNFVYHEHPGYRKFSKHEEDRHFIGHSYAKELNRAKIVFTCPSIFYYPVIKYFEVLACKSLLLAPTFPELEELGFIPNYHFVPIDEDNFMEKAAYYLANETERQQIAEQGYQFIRQKHSVKIRTEQLVKRIESIIQQ